MATDPRIRINIIIDTRRRAKIKRRFIGMTRVYSGKKSFEDFFTYSDLNAPGWALEFVRPGWLAHLNQEIVH